MACRNRGLGGAPLDLTWATVVDLSCRSSEYSSFVASSKLFTPPKEYTRGLLLAEYTFGTDTSWWPHRPSKKSWDFRSRAFRSLGLQVLLSAVSRGVTG